MNFESSHNETINEFALVIGTKKSKSSCKNWEGYKKSFQPEPFLSPNSEFQKNVGF